MYLQCSKLWCYIYWLVFYFETFLVYISDMSCKLSFLTATDRIQFLHNEVNNFCPQWTIQIQAQIMWRKNFRKKTKIFERWKSVLPFKLQCNHHLCKSYKLLSYRWQKVQKWFRRAVYSYIQGSIQQTAQYAHFN